MLDHPNTAQSLLKEKPKLHLAVNRKPYSLHTSSKKKRLPPIFTTHNSETDQDSSVYDSKQRAKTETIADHKQDLSPSYRQLSRFVYNHLQKKIQFQENYYQHIRKTHQFQNQQTPEFQEQNQEGNHNYTTNVNPGRHLPHIYGYQKRRNNTENLQIDPNRPLKRLRNKLARNNLRTNLISMVYSRQTKNYTHIDAYFDLSCLKNIKKANCCTFPSIQGKNYSHPYQ